MQNLGKTFPGRENGKKFGRLKKLHVSLCDFTSNDDHEISKSRFQAGGLVWQISSAELFPLLLCLYREPMLSVTIISYIHLSKHPADALFFFNYNHTWPSKINMTSVTLRIQYYNKWNVIYDIKIKLVIYIQNIEIDTS